MNNRLLCASLLSFVAIVGCGKQSPPSPAPAATNAATSTPLPASSIPAQAQPKLHTMNLWVGPQVMSAEIASSSIELQTGMMFRTNMAENEGMLFVFGIPHQTSFWMKNTSLPLSAAYISPDGVIQEIHPLEPFNTNSVVAKVDNIQYVLETPQGWFDRHNISTGTVVRLDSGSLHETFFGK
jgi:uncharacterized protein